MLEVAAGIVLAVVVLVRFGRMHLLAAGLFGGFLALAAAGLVHFLRFAPIDIAIGIVVAAVVLSTILRESDADRAREQRRT